MPLVSMRTILDHAAENSYGMPAFNVTNLETMHGVLRAAQSIDSPVILQATRSARTYMNDVFVKHMVAAALEAYPELVIAVHLDHGNNLASCQSAMGLGFSSVMMDGSLHEDGKTPADTEYNTRVTRSVVAAAHAIGVSVEGEIGVLGSLETGSGEQEDGHGFEGVLDTDQLVTDPADAAEFVAQTDVDALAVAIGTSHGAYKFSKKPDGDTLAMETLRAIHEALPSTHLVMHGASAVPQELQDKLNTFGGSIPQTFGLPLEEVEEGIRHGVRKVNIDTDIRMAVTAAIREFLQKNPASFDIRGYMNVAIRATQELCADRYERFGCAGHGSRIQSVSLPDMAARYANGSLRQNVKNT
ncbi:MAG: fructose-bisphosphate aldolase class II [Octadecabacter sp.]|nr:fructose-bisphosphate aldolase class II [Octadecabacter sp.]